MEAPDALYADILKISDRLGVLQTSISGSQISTIEGNLKEVKTLILQLDKLKTDI